MLYIFASVNLCGYTASNLGAMSVAGIVLAALSDACPVEGAMKLRFDVVIEKDGDGYYAYCPALRGLHVDGATEAEIFKNTEDAIRAYIASLVKHDYPLPVGCLVRENRPRLRDVITGWLARKRVRRVEEFLIAA